MRAFRQLLSSSQALREARWLRWAGPRLQHPRLWRTSRRGLALGVAIGLFFGVLIPLAQIPLSAAVAVALRANLPVAVASTLVSNPATFGPLYYAAWRVGNAVMGEPAPEVDEAQMPADTSAVPEPIARDSWIGTAIARVQAIGKPLLVGLGILALGAATVAYFAVSLAWTLRVRWRRRRGLHGRQGSPGTST